MARPRKALTKERVRAFLERHFFLRLHMFFILSATIASGLVATNVLLAIGVRPLALRYALAVCAAYLLFLALIRLWLFYVRMARGGVDFTGDGLDFSHGVTSSDFSGGGGNFGGGGASGSWGKALPDLGGDGDDWLVIVLFVAVVLSLLLIGIYVIYTAPVMLSEAAFEALLAAAVARQAKKIQRPGWIGVVWRATVWPFLVVLVLTAALGWVAQRRCPEAKKLRDVFHCPQRLYGNSLTQ
ncbi:MAG TPA: hypothetical protein VKB93_29345 [Thermoanaerobaculia bacterium]|nr:hypothetical protein [Thermoanaerobaculia bacterium]